MKTKEIIRCFSACIGFAIVLSACGTGVRDVSNGSRSENSNTNSASAVVAMDLAGVWEVSSLPDQGNSCANLPNLNNWSTLITIYNMSGDLTFASEWGVLRGSVAADRAHGAGIVSTQNILASLRLHDIQVSGGSFTGMATFSKNEPGNAFRNCAAPWRITGNRLTTLLPETPRISATSFTDHSIRLRWTTPSTMNAKFFIYRKEKNITGAALNKIAVVDGLSREFFDIDLTPNTTYIYAITAQNNRGETPSSNESEATTLSLPSTPPRAPTALSLARAGQNIALSWSATPDLASGYKILRSIDRGANYVVVATLQANVLNYQERVPAPQIASGQTYFYKVESYHSSLADHSGISSTSPVSVEVPYSAPKSPSKAIDVAASVQGDSRIELTWKVDAGAEDRIIVDRMEDGAASFTPVAVLSGDTRAYVDMGLDIGGLASSSRYHYRLQTVNEFQSISSGETAIDTIDLFGDVPNIVPSELNAVGMTDSKIYLQWNTNEDFSEVKNIVLERSISGGAFEPIANMHPLVNAYVDNALQPDTEYKYRLTSINSVGIAEIVPTEIGIRTSVAVVRANGGSRLIGPVAANP